ncbi:ferredoxin-like protein [Tissierella sp. Yu-01]|jgi:Fe-S-cluster-containing dehydrogenase component|uniref:ferredoxin-like protein n=1 Tax=Tissierella sp. Yu-01 TaxID=3035694 RepID=UPI00240D1006|nr:ferredoxin-like protein [Tissierella sp. Yu-01]WFA09990.1 ferredoxin-like protein [Tissierella sp. Yu-01]
MFEKEIEEFIEKVRTRREFLKMSGKGLAGITVTASVLNLIGCTKEEPTSTEVPTGAAAFVIPKGLIVSQPNRCTGCQRCEMVCTVANDGKVHPYVSRVKIARNFNYGSEMTDNYRNENGYFGNFLMTPETCRQCEDAKCAAACPADAISQNEATGAWTVDENKCVGCGACVQACPWNMPTIDPETGKSTKCILCGECAENCITGSLSLIPWEKLEAMLRRRGYRLS